MRKASPALARRSSGFGSPRSAKTLPLPSSTSIPLAMLYRPFASLQPCRGLFLGSLEARLDQVDLRFRCLNSGLRFLLEGVEHAHAASQPHGVDGAIGVTVMVLDNFQDSCAAKASERFRGAVLSALLGHIKRKAYRVLDLLWESAQVCLGAADPNDRFETGRSKCHHNVMPKRA